MDKETPLETSVEAIRKSSLTDEKEGNGSFEQCPESLQEIMGKEYVSSFTCNNSCKLLVAEVNIGVNGTSRYSCLFCRKKKTFSPQTSIRMSINRRMGNFLTHVSVPPNISSLLTLTQMRAVRPVPPARPHPSASLLPVRNPSFIPMT